MGHSEVAEMRFTESHEWITCEGKIGTVGITDHAQKELGEIVHIELPKVGGKVKAGEEVCVLESTKAAVDIYAPVSGKITAVNELLRSDPTKLKGTAWLFKIELSDAKELEGLLTSSDYKSLV